MDKRMERVGKKAMKGAVLFAFNNETVDYVKMAVFTAKRINKFLDLPVTIITDKSDLSEYNYTFDNVVVTDADNTNSRNKSMWLNKGRYRAFECSPYDETIVLDVDYVVNSNRLLKTFEIYEDFMCHKNVKFLMQPDTQQEKISYNSIDSVWATTMTFRKNKHVENIFNAMKMVQTHYHHYIELHDIYSPFFCNDYALALALRMVNGQTDYNRYFTPWNLLHVGPGTHVYKEKETEFIIVYDNWKNGKIKKEYMTVKDTDFHMLIKSNFEEIINE